MGTRTRLAIDKTVTLDINGSTQRIRLCAERAGLPPFLIVQAGPGWPVLNEVAKFRVLNTCLYLGFPAGLADREEPRML
jgi:hypothetical protein